MNKLDAVFKEKLSDHTMTPSTAVWEKLDIGLTKKNDRILWMRWAAILIPAAAMVTLLLYNPQPQTELVQKTPSQQPASAPVQKPVIQNQTASIDQVAPKHRESKPSRRVTQIKVVKEPVQTLPETVSTEPESVTLGEITIEPSPEPQAEQIQAAKPLVIVYTLESIGTPSAEAEEKKVTKLGRVVEFAQTVKYSDPLGDLRVLKDELLAIDLKKKSSKKN